MRPNRHDACLLPLLIIGLTAGCAGRTPSPRSAAVEAAPAPVSLEAMKMQAEQHLQRGICASDAGRFEEANQEFNLALASFGETPSADARIRALYDDYRYRIAPYRDDLDQEDESETPLEALGKVAFERADRIDYGRIRRAIQSVAFDFPLEITAEVASAVDYFATRRRRTIVAGLERGSRYLPMMRRVFRQEGVPEDLVYMALVESSFKPKAVSRSRARGIWQFMAETGRRYGLSRSRYVDERYDPEKATRAAAAYLRDLHAEFSDWYLAMAAYNCGEHRIERALAKTPVRDYFELCRRGLLPRETRRYVPAIVAGLIIAKNPRAFGFEPVRSNPLRYDSVVLPESTHLRVVSSRSGIPLRDLRELNPELRRVRTPRGAYSLKVPSGTAGNLVAEILALTPAERGRILTHRVRRGDTLSHIARKYGTTSGDIAEWNGISLRHLLHPGDELEIPSDRPIRQRRQRARKKSNPITYRVRRGDTLYGIASRYRVALSELVAWNHWRRGKRLHPGDLLTIYTR